MLVDRAEAVNTLAALAYTCSLSHEDALPVSMDSGTR